MVTHSLDKGNEKANNGHRYLPAVPLVSAPFAALQLASGKQRVLQCAAGVECLFLYRLAYTKCIYDLSLY